MTPGLAGIFLIFTGWQIVSSAAVPQRPVNAASDTIIKIGFLVENSRYESAINGARLAISDANQGSGRESISFELVVKSMEGPWGAGSKETVNLIFDHNVTGIAGSFDGRNAHLAEQVCAKSKVTLISAKASDPTLTQAFVPWYFCAVPGDKLQAENLINELYSGKRMIPAIIRDDAYDSRQAASAYVSGLKAAGKPAPAELIAESNDTAFTVLIKELKRTKPGSVVLFTRPEPALKIYRKIRNSIPGLPVYAHFSVIDEDKAGKPSVPGFEDVLVAVPGDWDNANGKSFSERYYRTYDYYPGPSASFAYDAVYILTEAITKAGNDRDRISTYIAASRFDGVTGKIEFDSYGNRKGINGKLQVKKWKPAGPDYNKKQ